MSDQAKDLVAPKSELREFSARDQPAVLTERAGQSLVAVDAREAFYGPTP